MKAEKAVAKAGRKVQFAAALSNGRNAEKCKRTRNYRRHVKKELSGARRRLDTAITHEAVE